MKYDELMAGAEALNAYYRNPSYESMVEVIDGYERLLSDYAEMAGCYAEWEERRTEGLEGE